MFQADATGVAMWRPTNGTPDGTFGTSGWKQFTPAAGDDELRSVMLDRQGRIVVTGFAATGGRDAVIGRLLADGTPDPSFGVNGFRTIDVGGNEIVQAAAIQQDGKIVAAGIKDSDVFVVRVDDTGTLDPTFGTGGTVTTPHGTGYDTGECVLLRADGRIVVGGGATFGTTRRWGLVQYTSSGVLDQGFGTGGKSSTQVGTGTDEQWQCVQTPTGSVVMAGTSYVGAAASESLVKWLPDGTLDPSFGTAGITSTTMPSGYFKTRDLVLQPNGRLVTIGYGDAPNDGYTVARYLANGTLDGSFGSAGITTIPLDPTGDDSGYAALLQGDGRILVSGFTTVSGSGSDVGTIRLTSTGSLDPTFGTGGKLTQAVSGTNDFVRRIAFGPDGSLLLAGFTWAAGSQDFMLGKLGGANALADYAGTWGGASSAFGACLHTVGGGASSVWTLAGSGNCTSALTANWAAIPVSAGVPAAKVATSPSGTTTATASLRFGVKLATGQSPGSYVAPITFEVVAPAA
jgi:uncharacterized delta-60 repeat protein